MSIRITIEFYNVSDAARFLANAAGEVEAVTVNPTPAPTPESEPMTEVGQAIKPRRGRKPAALPPIERPETAATPDAAIANDRPETVPAATGPASAAAPVTEAEAKAKLEEVFTKLGLNEAMELLSRVGAKKLRDVPEASYPKLVEVANEMLAA